LLLDKISVHREDLNVRGVLLLNFVSGGKSTHR